MSRIHEALGRGRVPAKSAPPPRSAQDEAVLAALGYQTERTRSRRGVMLVLAVVVVAVAGLWAIWPLLSRFEAGGARVGTEAKVDGGSSGHGRGSKVEGRGAVRSQAPARPAGLASATEVKTNLAVVTAKAPSPTGPVGSTASVPPAPRVPAQTPSNPGRPRSPALDSQSARLAPRGPGAAKPQSGGGPAAAPRRDDFQLALYYQRAGDFEQALLHYRAVLARDEMNVEAHNNLGSLYLGRNLLDEAAREFQRVLAIDPSYTPAHVNLSATLYKLGRFDAAASQAREALRIDPRNGDGLVNLALAQKASGQHGEAQSSLRRALELNSRHALAHYNLARQYEDAGEILRAVEHYRQFLQYAGPDQEPYAVDVRARMLALQARAIR